MLDDLEDREPRLVQRKKAPPWMGYQWPHRDLILMLRGAVDMRVVFISLQDDPPEKSLQIAPGTSHGYHTSNTWHVVQQKRGSVLLMDGTLIHPGARTPGRTIFFPFVPEKFRTPPNVVEPHNVPDLICAEPVPPCAVTSVCPFTMEGLGPEEENAEQCSMPWYHRWWIVSPMADNMVRVPVSPGCI